MRTGQFCVGRGRHLCLYDLNADHATLSERSSIAMPSDVQYAWQHPGHPILYVGCSDQARVGAGEPTNRLSAVRVDAESGLSLLGASMELPHRPIHVTVDQAGRNVVVTYNRPARLDVFRLNANGAIGDPVAQRPDLDVGIFPHQARLGPDDRSCFVVARGVPPTMGWWAARGDQTDPGCITVFDYDDGILGDATVLDAGNGYQFGPRHMDFHPHCPWIYVSVEIQNEVMVWERDARGRVDGAPLQSIGTLRDPDSLVRQSLGPLHVSEDGRIVYVANRGHQKVPDRQGRGVVPAQAENSIVAYSVDASSGLLTEIQRLDTRGICPRTFAIDVTGSVLVVANAEDRLVQQHESEPTTVFANLTTFAVSDDGTLEPRQTLELHTEEGSLVAWVGALRC